MGVIEVAEKREPGFEEEDIRRSGGSDWEDVTSSHEPGLLQREGMFAIVAPGGHVRLSVETTEKYLDIARMRGCDLKQHLLRLRANKKTGQMGCHATMQPGAGVTTPRQYTKKGTTWITFLATGLFRQYPELRPKRKVKCVVTVETAPDGLPMLGIAVKAGTRTGIGTGSSGSTKSKESNQKESPNPSTEAPADPSTGEEAAEE